MMETHTGTRRVLAYLDVQTPARVTLTISLQKMMEHVGLLMTVECATSLTATT